MSTAEYIVVSRSPRYSLALALPLLLLYELLAWALHPPVTSAAAVWVNDAVDWLLRPWDYASPLVLKGIVIAVIGVAVLWRRSPHALRAPYLGLMLFESFFYAVLLGPVITRALELFLPRFPGFAALFGSGERERLTLLATALGAGFYEELLFRAVLFSALVWILRRVAGRRWGAAVIAGLLSSALFSAAHHIGPHAEPFELYAALYRFVGGLLFAGLYVARGFAVTAYTHALYDMWVTL